MGNRAQTDADFTAFIAAHSPRLLRFARLLTGDADAAEDLLQGVLVRAYPRWSRIDQQDPVGYVRRALVNASTDRWKRSWRRERPTDPLPESAVPARDDVVATRSALLEALQALSPVERAVVVLRYFEDLTEAQTAELLGAPLGTVKSQNHRALRKLRVSDHLANDDAQVPVDERGRR